MTCTVGFNRLAVLSMLLVLQGMLAACAAINTGSYVGKEVDFGSFQSFSWIDRVPYVATESSIPVSPLELEMIESGIRTQLEKKGYAFTTDREAADLLVAFTVGTRDKVRMESYPVGYRGHWGWHEPHSHYYFRHVSAENYTKGTLGIDLFDNETGKPIWHGWAEKTVTQGDRTDPGPSIDKGLTKLFGSFPK